MAATTAQRSSETPQAVDAGAGLKNRLVEQLNSQRKPGQVLKVSQVSKNHFRVNWLTPAVVQGEASVMNTYRITQSQFLRVEELGGELVITDQTRGAEARK